MQQNTFLYKFLVSVFIIILMNFAPNVVKGETVPMISKAATPTDTPFIKGADISWVTEMEAKGIQFHNKNGVATDCFSLMKSIGMNSIRIRVWVHPKQQWNSADDVIEKAKRATRLGLKVLIDFHYSDNWADPGKQNKPANWANASLSALQDSLKQHTISILSQLKNVGVHPAWVQIGNETDDGMLWPEGKASVSMSNFASFIRIGYGATKSIFPETKVIVHVSNGWNNTLFRWIFDGLLTNGATWDIIGMSLYPSYGSGGWQKINQQCFENMNDMVSRYNSTVMIVEIGMPWKDSSTAKLFIQDLINKVKAVHHGKGLGVFYWEPECYNNWQDYALGAFDNTGKPTIALDPFFTQ